MTPEDFKTRTKGFALECIRLVESLPKTRVAFRLGDQLLRSGTSCGRQLSRRLPGEITRRFYIEDGDR